MHRANYRTNLFLSLFLIHIPALGMLSTENFTKFCQLAPELKSLVIAEVDNMSFIGQASKECYGLVQKKQIVYIISMHDNQNPSQAKFNIPPFIFFGNSNDFSGKYALDPSKRMFYKDSTREQYFSGNEEIAKKFPCRFIWQEKYEYIKPTNLLINIFKNNIDDFKNLLQKYYKILPETTNENKRENRETKQLLMNAFYTGKKLGHVKILELLEKHFEAEKIEIIPPYVMSTT